MIKGAVFDADGTLLDSMPIWEDIGSRFLDKHNIKAEDSLKDILFTMSLNKGAEYIKNHYRLKMTVEQVINEIVQIVFDFYANEVQLKEGIKEFLTKLKEKDIPMTVASSSDSSYLIKAFERLEIIDYFDEILTCCELSTDKSSARIYLKASEKFNCQTDEICIFEDAYHAAKTAHDAGFKVVGVYDPASRKDIDKMKNVCDIYVNSFSELDLSQL